MQKLSVVGADYRTEERVIGYYTSGDRMKAWGLNGAPMQRVPIHGFSLMLR